MVGAVNPGQREVFLPPREHPQDTRIKLVGGESRSIEGSGGRQRRHIHQTKIQWCFQLLQRRATDRRGIDVGVGQQLEHLLISLVEHRHRQVGESARLVPTRREFRRSVLHLAEQIGRAGTTSTIGVLRRLKADRA